MFEIKKSRKERLLSDQKGSLNDRDFQALFSSYMKAGWSWFLEAVCMLPLKRGCARACGYILPEGNTVSFFAKENT